MRPAREVLVLPVAFFAAGIVICGHVSFSIAELSAPLAAFAVLWVVVGQTGSLRPIGNRPGAGCQPARRLTTCPTKQLILWSGFLMLGAMAAELHRPSPRPELEAAPGETLLVSGCIVEPVIAGPGMLRFVIELQPGARVRTTLVGEALPILRYGQMVEVQARVRKPRNFGNPGAFDYVGWLARQKVFWTASARGKENLRVLPGDCGPSLQRAAMRVREAVVRRIDKLYPQGSYERQVLPALLVGATGTNDRDWTEGYRRTGTYHALVVSGLHIAVVAGAVLLLLRFTGLPLGLVLSVAAVMAWGYAAVVNWQPPALRSAAGFTLFLIARWFFRRGRVLNLLAAVLLMILAVDPQGLYDASLQLTALSVAAIGGLAAPLTERGIAPYAWALRRLGDGRLVLMDRAGAFRVEMRLLAFTAALCTRTSVSGWFQFFSLAGRLALWVIEAALLSACVQLALAVPLALHFHTFSATALGANIVVAPALSLAVPVGLLACATGFPPLVALTSGLLAFARVGTDLFFRFEPGIRVPDPPTWVPAAALGTVSVLAYALLDRRRWWPIAATGACAIAAVIWTYPFHPDLRTGSLELTVIDVGQGDSLLVVTPDGRTLLMDAGGIPAYGSAARPTLEPGEDVVSPYLWRRGIKRLDVVAVSHLHEDHSGGVPAIIRNFRPTEVWIGAAPAAALRSLAGTRVRQLRAGDTPWRHVTVLAPDVDYVPGEKPHNRDSLVLLFRHGRHSFLLTGDTDGDIDASEVDVLKVAHHGSRTATSIAFLQRALPLFAAISAGAENSYGHPHPDLLGRLRRSGAQVLRTDRDGLITFWTDGHTLSVER